MTPRAMIKKSSLVLMLSIFCSQPVFAQSPSEDEGAVSALLACAIGIDSEAGGEIVNSFQDILNGKGAEVSDFDFIIKSDFLLQFKEEERVGVYKIYTECVLTILGASSNRTSSQAVQVPKPIPINAPESADLQIFDRGNFSGKRFYDYNLNFTDDDFRYWIVVETPNGDQFLQSGGDVGGLPVTGDTNRFIVEVTKFAYPAVVYAAGFDPDDFQALEEQTQSLSIWLLDQRRTPIRAVSNICIADETGALIGAAGERVSVCGL